MFTATLAVVNQGALHSPGQAIRSPIAFARFVRVRTEPANLLRNLEQFGGYLPHINLYGFDRLFGIDHMNSLGRSDRFVQKTFSYALAILNALAFHAIERTVQAAICAVDAHIEHEHTIGHQPACGDLANLPNLLRVQPAGVPLINNIRQQIAIGDDNAIAFQGRSDDLVHELRPGRHVQQHFAAAVNWRGGIDRQQQLADAFAKWRTARIATDDDIKTMTAQGIFKQADLRRFSNPVDAVERKKQLVTFFVNRSQVFSALSDHPAKTRGFQNFRLVAISKNPPTDFE